MPNRLYLATALFLGALAACANARAQDLLPADPALGSPPAQTSVQPASQPWLQTGATAEPPVKEEFGLADRLTALTRGRVQIESGYVFTYDRSHGTSSYEHVLPDMLLRVGLTERLEVRVGWAGYHSVHYSGSAEGSSYDEILDPSVGLMVDLFPQNGWIPQTALQAGVPISLDSNPLAFDSVQPMAQALYLWELDDRWAVGGTSGAILVQLDGDRHVEFQQSLSLDYVLSDRLGSFLQWTGVFGPSSYGDGPQHMLSGGLSFLWTDRFQTTWETGVGLSPSAPDLLTAIRFSYRF